MRMNPLRLAQASCAAMALICHLMMLGMLTEHIQLSPTVYVGQPVYLTPSSVACFDPMDDLTLDELNVVDDFERLRTAVRCEGYGRRVEYRVDDCLSESTLVSHQPLTIPACFTAADDELGYTLLIQEQGDSDLHCRPELDEHGRPSTWCTPFVDPTDRFDGPSGL